MSLWVKLGAAAMFIAVAAGAFGAHALKAKLSADMLAVWETGARYLAYHGLALLFVAWLSEKRSVDAAGWCFVAGGALFSGSLFALALTGIRILGAVTPIGGLAFLAGWLILLIRG